MRATSTAIALAAGAVALAIPAVAAGARPATPAEARAMAVAVRTTPVAGIRSVPRDRYVVTRPRVSTLSRYWGIASIVARPAFRDTLEGALVVLVRTGGPTAPGPWVAVDAGTSGVGCAVAPYRVLRDLGIAGECPVGDRL